MPKTAEQTWCPSPWGHGKRRARGAETYVEALQSRGQLRVSPLERLSRAFTTLDEQSSPVVITPFAQSTHVGHRVRALALAEPHKVGHLHRVNRCLVAQHSRSPAADLAGAQLQLSKAPPR